MNSVKLIENFVTWQGEGPDSGRRMVLLRFKTCNLNCTWCDTAVKMRVSAEASYTLEDIQNQINLNCAGLMITGGEPTVARHIDETILLLNELNYSLANVETNGHNLPQLINSVFAKKPIHYIFSPKLFSNKDVEKNIDLVRKINEFSNVFIKLVYEENSFNTDFLDSVTEIFDTEKIWLMPEGVTKEELIKNSGKVFDICERYNINFSSRNHIVYGFI